MALGLLVLCPPLHQPACHPSRLIQRDPCRSCLGDPEGTAFASVWRPLCLSHARTLCRGRGEGVTVESTGGVDNVCKAVLAAGGSPVLTFLPTEGLSRRKKTSLWFVGSLLLVSVLIVTVGLAATTRTENVTVGGYYPGIILGFGSFLGIIGINLVENRRQMLVAAIVFISFGVVAAFCCAIVDGVFAAQHI
uniref:Transmembrane protein 255B n=1 Tax=Nomascus leucogenys TaxID=61853 RepID=A0A2I3HBU7_NOMLE